MSLLKVLGLQRPATMSGAAASKVSALGHGAAAAAASGSKAGGVPGVVRVATGDFFRPALRVLSPVGTAMALPQNGEATIDLLVENWDDAPPGAVMGWTVTVGGKGVAANVVNKAGQGYLTLRGMTAGATDVVTAVVHVKVEELEVPFKFPSIVVIVDPADTSLDASRLDDQGGPATSGQLDQDVTNLLVDWESAAKTGISHFVTSQLEKKIDDLSAGSWASWSENLLGNTLWALTVFSPTGVVTGLLAKNAVKFTVSMVGIAAPAMLNRPDGHSVPGVQQMQDMMDDHIMKVHQGLKQKLAPQVQRLLKTIPTMTRFEAIGKFAAAMFLPGTVHVDAKFGIVPTINESIVAARYERMATLRLQKYVALEEARRQEERNHELGPD